MYRYELEIKESVWYLIENAILIDNLPAIRLYFPGANDKKNKPLRYSS